MGQTSANDNTPNLKYPALDKRIESTYASRSDSQLKSSLYDSYIRALRWATDRIGDEGIVCYVSNGGYIEANTADGLRLTLADEFDHIYIWNLRGNQRTSGELSRKEGGKIFGAGSRATTAILIAIKAPDSSPTATIHYADIGDYLDREEKLARIAEADLHTVPWQEVVPDDYGDWINKRDPDYPSYAPLGAKGKTAGDRAIVDLYSQGVATSRDAWVFNFNRASLVDNVERGIANYNKTVKALAREVERDPKTKPESVIAYDSALFHWGHQQVKDLSNHVEYAFDQGSVRESIYRPFCRQFLYFNRSLNNRVYQLPRIFPSTGTPNYGIYVVGPGSNRPFSALMTNAIPEVQLTGSQSNGQYLARYRYEKSEPKSKYGYGQSDMYASTDRGAGYQRIDNVSESAVVAYRNAYGPAVTRDDIFYYCYGLLHSPDYRHRFAADLKKQLPRIPLVHADDYAAFVNAGRGLADLHINYETVDPFDLAEEVDDKAYQMTPAQLFRVEKMRWASKTDHSRLIYNRHITLSGVPDEAHEYMLGGRSALDWIIDRYQVKTDKKSGITNDPNTCSDDPTYILDLFKRITTVSVRTMQIVNALPLLRILEV